MNILNIFENCVVLSIQDIRLNKMTEAAGRLEVKQVKISEANEDGSYQCTFTLKAATSYLKFNIEDNIVDKAEVTFDLELNNCYYDEAIGWRWESINGYQVIGGQYQPNIIVYCGTIALNSTAEGQWYLGGLNEKQDKSISSISPAIMIAKTKKEDRTEFIHHLVSSIETMRSDQSCRHLMLG